MKPRRTDDGPGIGLAIVRRLVEAHRGHAWIDQAPSGGARVHVFWPKPG
jgi:signal transduction histidine kinase